MAHGCHCKCAVVELIWIWIVEKLKINCDAGYSAKSKSSGIYLNLHYVVVNLSCNGIESKLNCVGVELSCNWNLVTVEIGWLT